MKKQNGIKTAPFSTVFYAPAILATLPAMVMLNTWIDWAVLMINPSDRGPTDNCDQPATESPGSNVIPIGPAVTSRSASVTNVTDWQSKGSNNVVPLAGKHTKRSIGRTKRGKT